MHTGFLCARPRLPSVAGVAAAAVAAAKVASEKQTDDGAAGSNSEMAAVE